MMEKTSKFLQYIGTALAIFSVLLMFAGDFWDHQMVKDVAEHNQAFFWLGVLLWAFGYMKVEQDKKKKP